MRRPVDEHELYERAVSDVRAATSKPPDAARVARMLRRIDAGIRVTQPSRSHRSWRFGLVSAAVAASLILVVALRWPSTSIRGPRSTPAGRGIELVMQSGAVVLSAAEQVSSPTGTTIVSPDSQLSLESQARVDVAVGSAARMAVVGPARVRFRGGRPVVALGTAMFSVAPHHHGTSFALDAGDAEVIVHGTEFAVAVADGRLQRLQVREGVVELRTPDGEEARFLRAGESWGAAEQESAAADFDEPWWSGRATERESTGFLSVVSTPPGALVRIDGASVGNTPFRARWPSGSYEVSLTLVGYEDWSGEATVAGRRQEEVVAALRPDAPKTPREPKAPPAPRTNLWSGAEASLEAKRCDRLARQVAQIIQRNADPATRARATMLEAECALRTGHKTRALAAFDAVQRAYPATPSAEAALFEAAKLESELRQKPRALAALDDYLARYPGGRFIEAASFRRCELLIDLRRLGEAAECLVTYRTRFPTDHRAPLAALLLATLARVEARWSEAATYYRQYLAHETRSSREEEAAYYLVVCLRRGGLQGIDAAVADYLRRFPNGPHAAELGGR